MGFSSRKNGEFIRLGTLSSSQSLTCRCRSLFVMVFPYDKLPTSFIVSAIIAFEGSASPAQRALDTASLNGLKHGLGVYSIT